MLCEIHADDPAFKAALRQAGLPTDDLVAEGFRYFNWEDLAFGGVGEGVDALIRSVVVLPPARGKGYGVVIVESLADVAREAHVKRLWLLTMSAAPFFGELGWRVATRERAPPAIARTRQFSGLCPVSSTLMVRAL